MNRSNPKTEVRAFGTRHVGAPKRRGQKTVAELRAELDALELQIAAGQTSGDRTDVADEERHRAGLERLAIAAAAARMAPRDDDRELAAMGISTWAPAPEKR